MHMICGHKFNIRHIIKHLQMSSVISSDCLWLYMTVDSTVICKAAMKVKLWKNSYHPPSQRGSYNVLPVYITYNCNCNMETPKKRLSKYWCSVPHCQCDIRNIYIKAAKWTKCITIEKMEDWSTGATTFDSHWKH
jgi:hypothetical protein